MIRVERVRPTTTRTVCAPRRGMLRMPIWNMMRLEKKITATVSRATAKSAAQTMAIALVGMPNRLSMVASLLVLDQAIAHVDRAVAACTDVRIVGDDDERLLMLAVQGFHQRDDLVGGL